MRKYWMCAILLCFLLMGCGSAVQGVSTLSPTQTVRPTATRLAPTATPAKAATTSQAAAPTATPAAVPQKTATPPPFVIHPRLGDTIAAWDSFYGTFKDVSIMQEAMHGYVDTTTATSYQVIAGFDKSQHNRVITVTIQLSGAAQWSAASEHSFMFPLQFFPNDAVDNGEQPVPENGIEWQWHSTLLEHAFPASYFIDNAGMQVTPGTCNAFYQYTDSTEKVVGHVTLSLGEVYGL